MPTDEQNGRTGPYGWSGRGEVEAVKRVAESGQLSGFYGTIGPQFLGGPVVQQFERAWQERFRVRHAVSVNSATSGLYAAMGAIGITPGDEGIVPAYTMSATVVAPLIYGGVSVVAGGRPPGFAVQLPSVAVHRAPA